MSRQQLNQVEIYFAVNPPRNGGNDVGVGVGVCDGFVTVTVTASATGEVSGGGGDGSGGVRGDAGGWEIDVSSHDKSYDQYSC